MSANIQIAIAVVEQRGQLLIGQRPPGASLAGLWEFPGGKIEAQESPQAATIRECLEETGIEVEVLRKDFTHCESYAHGDVELHFFRCQPTCGLTPKPPFIWVDKRELGRFEFPSGNRQLLAMLANELGLAE